MTKYLDFSYTQNREISWLQFDKRVLDEADDVTVPLYERMKMSSIFSSNLDEFFMIRIGGLTDMAQLKKPVFDSKSNLTPQGQIELVFSVLPDLVIKHDATVAKVEHEAEKYGITRVFADSVTPEDKAALNQFYEQTILPVISPQIINPRHPFPNLHNMDMYAVWGLESEEEQGLLGLTEIPSGIDRIVELPTAKDQFRYMLLEDVVALCAASAFGEYEATSSAIIRVTRNADIDPDSEIFDEEDYRMHMKKVLKKRLRLAPVRLEIKGKTFPSELRRRIRKELGLKNYQVFSVTAPLDMGYMFMLEDHFPEGQLENVTFKDFEPQPAANIEQDRPIAEQVRERDILNIYPYESMNSFLRLARESAVDPNVVSIRVTLYRVAKRSNLCESLVLAAENGIEVTVLMELRARFDEENNIAWAERLEDAGCTVIYGSEGFKVHSKICQITRRDNGQLWRLTHLGTGNYNEKTAKLYSDFSLMTAHKAIGEDGAAFFRNLTIGNLEGNYKHLGVAPTGLKPLIMMGINREIARAKNGEPAFVRFKMNSLTDRELIDKISEASNAGVKIQLIIRSISCLLPGLPNKTENVEIHTIVGRMLEHARIYAFGEDFDTIYLSSADLMTRNTERRVEIAFPVLDATCAKRVIHLYTTQWADNTKARFVNSIGKLEHIPVAPGDTLINAQDTFIKEAIDAAIKAGLDPHDANRVKIGPAPLEPDVTSETPIKPIVNENMTIDGIPEEAFATREELIEESEPEPVIEPEIETEAPKQDIETSETKEQDDTQSSTANIIVYQGASRFATAAKLIGLAFRVLVKGKIQR